MAIAAQIDIPECLTGPVAAAISLFLVYTVFCTILLRLTVGAEMVKVLRKSAQSPSPWWRRWALVVKPSAAADVELAAEGQARRRRRQHKKKRSWVCFVLGGDCSDDEVDVVKDGPFNLDDSVWLAPPVPEDMTEHFIGDTQPLGSHVETAGPNDPSEDVYVLEDSVWRVPSASM